MTARNDVESHEPVTLARAAVAQWGVRLFTALGAEMSVATQTIDHLLEAEDAGHPSHGLRMVRSIAADIEQGHIDPAATPVVDSEAGSVCLIDGRLGIGPPIGRFATDAAIRLAHSHGASAVGVRASGHMGRLASFAEYAAAHGCVLFICANDGGANQVVVPPGGLEGRLSTNPLAFGIPRSQPPHLVIDMATSVYAHGTVAALRELGLPSPDNALAAGGNGLLLPLGGHKGFALGLVVEALAGALTGAGVVGEVEPPGTQGALLFSINIAAFGSPAAAIGDVEAAIAWVRSAPTADQGPIRIPGESRANGAGVEVRVPAGLWDELTAISDRYGVDAPEPRHA